MKYTLATIIFLSLAIYWQDKPQTVSSVTITVPSAAIPTKCPTHDRDDDGHGIGRYEREGKTLFTFCTREFHEVQFRLYEQNGLTLHHK